MKLCTFKVENEVMVGVELKSGDILDVNSGHATYLESKGHPKPQEIADVILPKDMIGIIKSGDLGKDAILKSISFIESTPNAKGIKGEKLVYSPHDIKFMAPIPAPSKVFVTALNNKHSFEMADKCEDLHPFYNIKTTTCVTGPYDPIEIPDIGVVGSEAELAIIIGKKAKFIKKSEAEDYVYGYTVHNDITAHELRETKEWMIKKGPEGERFAQFSGRYKNFDTFSPMGPWLVTVDEIDDVNNLDIKAYVNDKLVQTGNTGAMYFKIPYLISYLSEAHTLLVGDIISWGTIGIPSGGISMLDIDLRAWGGVLKTEVSQIGTIENPIKAI